jgi:hypothetical protein
VLLSGIRPDLIPFSTGALDDFGVFARRHFSVARTRPNIVLANAQRFLADLTDSATFAADVEAVNSSL